MSVSHFREKFDGEQQLQPGQINFEEEIRVCGRVHRMREAGKKLKFVDILQGESKVQVKLRKQDDFYRGEFNEDCKYVKRGDIVGVVGVPMRTDAGELSVLAKSLDVLTPVLGIVPSGVLEKTDGRFRRRHLDLMTNPEVRNIFRTRSAVVQHIRDFLIRKDFMEVETPSLISGVGGANAAPFETYHQDLQLDLSLRIAPELHLKMLTVGGFDRVFEIGKQFRNESIDKNHNPEFTSCEFYMAYADYQDLIDITQQMLGSLAQKIPGNATDAFSRTPYAKLEFVPALESATGTKFPNKVNNEAEVRPFLRDLCVRNGVNLASIKDAEVGKLYDKLFGKLIEPELQEPTFVVHQPMCMSPLAKSRSSNPDLAERFELYAGGMELINAYTELNDPEAQRRSFAAQKGHENNNNNPLQEDFLDALEFGLPPTAGWGLGIDRLVMLVTGQKSIREVLLFPTMRPT